MKIAFIWPFNKAKWILPNWRDGHRAVIELLGVKHKVDWFLEDEYKKVDGSYDFYLVWTDSVDPIIHKLMNFKGRKGIMLTSNAGLSIATLANYNVVYCESQPIVDEVRRSGLRAIKAFGTDSDFFTPDTTITKNINYFYPATFSPWKRQSYIAHLGHELFCVGTLQPDGVDELEACKQNEVRLKIGFFPAKEIRDYYMRAHKVHIPAVHGSERTVLEAMSMNILPKILNKENYKAQSYIDEYILSGEPTPRDFILRYYSAKDYLNELLRGING